MASSPPTKTVVCGTPPTANVRHQWDFGTCGTPLPCLRPDPRTHRARIIPAFATFIRARSGGWVLRNVWCPAAATAAPDLAALRDQVLRLLPHVGIGAAPPGGTTLVNIQTLLWADTPSTRSLGTVTVVGRRVQLRIGFDHAAWDFDDGETDTSPDPGKPYDSAGDPCRSVQCPDYYGHIYTRTGTMTVRLTIAWNAQFSLDGHSWTDVDAVPLTGATSTLALTVRQARGVLVPDPTR